MSFTSADKHRGLRDRVAPAIGVFMDDVYERMTEEQRNELSPELFDYVQDITRFALSHLDEWAEALAETVARLHEESPGGERFIRDPVRTTTIVDAILFLDSDSQLVSVRNAKITRINKTRLSLGELVMDYYQSYEVLTGPNTGKRFTPQSRPLPDRPVYRPGVVLGGVGAVHLDQKPVSPKGSAVNIFLCHASEDKQAVRSLSAELQRLGHAPWLDAEKLLPGQPWESEIAKAIRNSHVVLVCLSRRSEKRGFVQKEIVRALDVADEQPEGAIFIIPTRLEECVVPSRLSRWQWVDLFEKDGLARLQAALEVVAQGLN